MSARGAKKGENRAAHDPSQKPPTPEPRPDDEDGIEILEVVGVDETTGEESEDARAGRRRERRDPGEAEAAPGATRALREAIAEKEKYYDLFLRKQAEFENFRKRTEREREDLRAGALAECVKGILPALDNLERALRTSEGSNDPLRQGVVLIHQQFMDALRREGIVPMETLGTHFDPRLHEAVQVLDVEGFEQGVVLEETQRGYMIRDKLLRPAMVKVAGGRRQKAGRPDPESGAGSR